MLQRHAPLKVGPIHSWRSTFCSRTVAGKHTRTLIPQKSCTQVSASALSLTVNGLTPSTAELPAAHLLRVRSAAGSGAVGLHHALFGSSGTATTAAQAAPHQTAAVTSAAQQAAAGQSVAGWTPNVFRHAVHFRVAAASAAAQAADAARQHLWQLLAACRGVGTVIAVVLGAALLLLLIQKAWRRAQQGRQQIRQPEQDIAASESLAMQKHRLLQALDEFVEEPPAANKLTFEAILDDYRSLLDNTVQTLDADGLPVGEAIINPMYSEPDANSQEVQQQWAEFVAAAKLDEVRAEAWWDIADVAEQRQVVADDIDWNA